MLLRNSFRKGITFLLFSGIMHSYAQQTSIDNITSFAKVYGYVRFFHPSDEAISVNWNLFAGYGTQHVEGCKSPKELRDSLYSLFLPIHIKEIMNLKEHSKG